MLKKYWKHVFCITILSLIIGFHGHFYVVLFLWSFFGFLCLRDPRLAIDSVFFFAAFFHGAGFFQNPLVTIKHFHIALAILLLVSFVRRKETRWRLKENWCSSMVLIFWIVLIAISAFSLWWVGEDLMRGIRTNGNLFLTLMCGSILAILLKPEEAMRGLGFLVIGTCMRAVFSLFALCNIPGSYVQEVILYNNHLGFYCTIALLCLLPCIVSAANPVIKRYSVVAFCFLFYVLLFTGSRTGYISFVGGSICFAILKRWLRKRGFSTNAGNKLKSIWLLVLLICFGSVLAFLVLGKLFYEEFLFPIVSARLWMIFIMFMPNYWHSLHSENFYFLGNYRLMQFKVLAGIMKQHLFLGVGLTQRVTDFHSLYLTILGGTGFVGLLTFLGFCAFWIRQIFHAMVPDDGKANVFRAALLSCMAIWLLYSLTESFFLFFNVWVIIAAGIALSKRMIVEQQLSDT